MSSKSGSRRRGRGGSSEYYYDDYEDDDRRASSADRKRSAAGARRSQDGRSERSRRTEDYDREYSPERRSSHSEQQRRRRREQKRHRMILIVAAAFIIAAVILALMAVTGSIGSTDYTASTIEFLENGKIRVTSVESFDQDYYDADELEETIRDAVSEYGSGVEQEYLNVSDGTAKLVLTYDSAEDYVSFNGTDLFIGTVAEAEEAGYDFQSIMSAVSQEDTSKILNEATLEQLSDNEVIILCEQADVVTYTDMLYATSNLGVTDATHASAIDTISDETPAIVILVSDG